ncbi:sigma-54-dependent transcriptional regulator [Hyalangium rubrum]|uniref:Sigma 54-interacting transcriptional regulator n=1 Tax=Hyalangium rubrum TaxID=3103134 RepID=A0ABU5H0G5_9BACT|nr:sigma 54-interacting transcriptional regulator [Hyalangium sp. s54d21]MDY7226811.1 sigma 54-interacting transcriptional regulator [Hyalangium sp. s54d21]
MNAQQNPIPRYLKGEDPRTHELFRDLCRYARTREPILILGETGTGKEIVAQEIHAQSHRRDKHFQPVNCAGLAHDLAGSELFGHEKGAFTGAGRKRPGLIREADGGTLFLDEFGDLPQSVQVMLLRFLQDSSIRGTGADKTETLNVRIIAATNRDIEGEAQTGNFRRDLIARFQKILRLAPLRERPGDIHSLALAFIQKHAGQEGMNPSAHSLSLAALNLLGSQRWPDNVRQLERAIKDALITTYDQAPACLDIHHFSNLQEHPSSKDSAVDSASHEATNALQHLAESILSGLCSGDLQPEKLPLLADRFFVLPLEHYLAQAFLKRFSGKSAEEMADKLFTYKSAEAVRRFLRKPARSRT